MNEVIGQVGRLMGGRHGFSSYGGHHNYRQSVLNDATSLMVDLLLLLFLFVRSFVSTVFVSMVVV